MNSFFCWSASNISVKCPNYVNFQQFQFHKIFIRKWTTYQDILKNKLLFQSIDITQSNSGETTGIKTIHRITHELKVHITPFFLQYVLQFGHT